MYWLTRCRFGSERLGAVFLLFVVPLVVVVAVDEVVVFLVEVFVGESSFVLLFGGACGKEEGIVFQFGVPVIFGELFEKQGGGEREIREKSEKVGGKGEEEKGS